MRLVTRGLPVGRRFAEAYPVRVNAALSFSTFGDFSIATTCRSWKVWPCDTIGAAVEK